MSSVCEISHSLPTTRVSSLSCSTRFLHSHTDAIRIHHFGLKRLLSTCFQQRKMHKNIRLRCAVYVASFTRFFILPNMDLSEGLTNSLTAGHQKTGGEWKQPTLRAYLENVWAHWSRSGIPRLQLWNNRVQKNYLSQEGETGGGKKKKKKGTNNL